MYLYPTLGASPSRRPGKLVDALSVATLFIYARARQLYGARAPCPLGRALKTLLDETHFFVFLIGVCSGGGVNFLALAACKSVSDAPTAVLATGVGGERTRRVGERMDA